MYKEELFNRVSELVRGKDLSDTDLRLTYNDEIESASRNGDITKSQRDRWYPTERELSKLKKITKRCSC